MSKLIFALIMSSLLSIHPSECLTEPSCEIRRYCRGYALTTLPIGSDVTQRLQSLKEDFCGCVIIDGSVNIYLNNSLEEQLSEEDFTFLYHVEQISGAFQIINVRNASIRLPNLALVRGDQQTTAGYSLGIYKSTLNKLELPQFRELSQGRVLLEESLWCGVTTVNWEDIVEMRGEPVVFLPQSLSQSINDHCEPLGEITCQNCSGDYCWSQDQCQTLNKIECPPFCVGDNVRCGNFMGTQFCCNPSCAAGCVGTPSNCTACKYFDENGTCTEQCTRRETVDAVGMLIINPEGTVQVGDHLCLPSCPAGLVEKRGICIESCGPGFFVSGGVCEQCVGTCPNGIECDGWNYDEEVEPGDTLDQFINNECAIVNGHIRINARTVTAFKAGTITEATLQRFRFVKVIRGVLLLSFWRDSLPPLNFFRNVEYIGSADLSTEFSDGYSLSIHVNFDWQNGDDGISRVDLSRLKRIVFGNVSITGNPNLCYYGDLHHLNQSRYFHLEGQDVIARNFEISSRTYDPYLNTSYCESIGSVCHSECVRDRRCWGPDDTNCVECVNYRYEPENLCVFNCTEYNDTFANDDTKFCEQCHEQCIGCHGPGPFNCKECRYLTLYHNKSTVECVGSCPVNHYVNETVCVKCHDLCLEGCTGSGVHVGPGGCNRCKEVLFDADFQQISCVERCLPNTYLGILSENTDSVPEGNLFCAPCHELCDGCRGPSFHECINCKHAGILSKTINGVTDDDGNSTTLVCLDSCPPTHYNTTTKICQECHEECIGCVGGGPGDCLACRNVRVEVVSSGEYECIAQCSQSDFVDLVDGLPTCVDCHIACEQCIGPGPSNCTRCTSNSQVKDQEVVEHLMMRMENGSTVDVYENITLYTCELVDTVLGTSPSDTLPWYYILLLGGGVPLAVIMLLIILGCLGYRFYKKYRSDVKYQEGDIPIVDNPMYGVAGDLFIKPTLLPQPKVAPNLARILIVPEDSLELLDELGSGAFGTVYKAYWQPEGEEHQYTVAVKVLNTSSAEANQELLEEGVAMASMDHSNVVRLYALCMGQNMMLISEFVMLGSLLSFLRKHKDNLNALTMMSFIQQIAEGMSYLEEKRMVHRDLAARNVLVQSYENVKITDFGLTKCLDVGESGYQAGAGKVPLRWLAPECIRKREYSHKSDVWAYGVTVWEILTFGARPYGDQTTKDVIIYIDRGNRLSQPATCTLELYSSMLSCWMLNPDSRPDFATLATKFANFSSDPCRYISTTADSQLEDYNQLPVNEAEIVDAAVYEVPDDKIVFSEPGEYDNPDEDRFAFSETGAYDNPDVSDEPMDYTDPGEVTEDQPPPPAAYKLRIVSTSGDNKVTRIDDMETAEYLGDNDGEGDHEYNYILDGEDTATTTIVANEYAYIDDQEVGESLSDGGENEQKRLSKVNLLKSKFDKPVSMKSDPSPSKLKPGKKKVPEVQELSRMEEYEDYPEWNTVGLNPLVHTASSENL